MPDRSAVRDEVTTVFEGADYPISGPMEIVPALPDGPQTKIETDEFSMTALELYNELDGDFPYDDCESFVDDVMAQLDERGRL